MRLLPWSTSLHLKLVLALAVLVALVATGAAYVAFEREQVSLAVGSELTLPAARAVTTVPSG